MTTGQISRINDLVRTARTSWFGQLSYFAFIGVTILGVSDADFYFADQQTQLPLIGLGIPTYLFFSVAPILGAVLFAYFHQHLLKLWEALGEADAKVEGACLS